MDEAEATLAERAGRLRAILAGTTLVMVALSWPLWIDLADFPAVPFVGWFPEYDRSWSWLGLLGIVAGLSLGVTRRIGRVGVAMTIPILIWLILGDQLRFQPWAYQFLVIGALLVVLPPRWSLAFGRVWMASVYFHSGLSKLDASFVHDIGPLFVRTLVRVLGVGSFPIASIAARRESASLILPAGEIVIAALLLIPRARRIGYIGLVLIHAGLLLILGPWGLGHSTIVLVWNVALAVEEYVLFWQGAPSLIGPAGRTSRMKDSPQGGPDGEPFGLLERAVAVPFALLLVLPLGERVGVFDSWPSHALYAGHTEKTTFLFNRPPGGVPGALPRDLRVAANRDADGVLQLKLTDWTRRVRGVPIYPQIRYGNGLAEWAFARAGEGLYPSFEVEHRLRADPITGRSIVVTVPNLKEATELSERFWFNAHPKDRPGR
jgi:hypothetical protein